jgi:hypothetical protein
MVYFGHEIPLDTPPFDGRAAKGAKGTLKN